MKKEKEVNTIYLTTNAPKRHHSKSNSSAAANKDNTKANFPPKGSNALTVNKTNGFKCYLCDRAGHLKRELGGSIASALEEHSLFLPKWFLPGLSSYSYSREAVEFLKAPPSPIRVVMDKSWVKLDRAGEEYKTCLQQFIDDSLLVASYDGMLKCPCKKCYNRFWREPNLVWAHLLYEGMDPHYEDQVWVFHGEHLPDPDFMEEVEEQQLCEPTVNEIHNVLYDVFGSDSSANNPHVDTEGQTTNVRAEYAEKLYDLLNDANTHLYPGSTKMKKLEFLVKLYQAKCLSGSTDKGMDIMLKLVKSILPDGETLPNSFYDHCGQSRYQKQDVEENGDTRKGLAKNSGGYWCNIGRLVQRRGVSPDRCKMFELCHLRKNGTPVIETTVKAMRHPCNRMHS
ncbi:unnamed protein product [Prunus armeniaca]